MAQQEEILDRIIEVEKRIDDIANNKKIKQELLAITECAKRDLLIQQKKHYRDIVRGNLVRKVFEVKINKRIQRIEIGFCFLSLTMLVSLTALIFFNRL